MSDPRGALPPAGWYPDPNGTPQHRWWDGQTWTVHVQQAQATGADMLALQSPANVISATSTSISQSTEGQSTQAQSAQTQSPQAQGYTAQSAIGASPTRAAISAPQAAATAVATPASAATPYSSPTPYSAPVPASVPLPFSVPTPSSVPGVSASDVPKKPKFDLTTLPGYVPEEETPVVEQRPTRGAKRSPRVKESAKAPGPRRSSGATPAAAPAPVAASAESWITPSVWALALMPIIRAAIIVGGLYAWTTFEVSPVVAGVIALLPTLIAFSAANNDRKSLLARGFSGTPHPAWSIIGEWLYLGLRVAASRRQSNTGGVVIWVWVATALVVVGAAYLAYLQFGFPDFSLV